MKGCISSSEPGIPFFWIFFKRYDGTILYTKEQEILPNENQMRISQSMAYWHRLLSENWAKNDVFADTFYVYCHRSTQWSCPRKHHALPSFSDKMAASIPSGVAAIAILCEVRIQFSVGQISCCLYIKK